MKAIPSIFKARLSRRAYVLWWLLPILAVWFLLSLLPVMSDPLEDVLAWFSLALLVIVAVVDVPLGMARFRDGGLSGWWYALIGWPVLVRFLLVDLWAGLTPFAGRSTALLEGQDRGPWEPASAPLLTAEIAIVALLLTGAAWSLFRLAARAGDTGPNKYGADPLGTADGT